MRLNEQRRDAVVALYQHDVTGRPVDELFQDNARPYTRALAHASLDYQDELDDAISRHATGWTLDRIAPLERAILRCAALELLHPELSAKRFCGADAPGFVNGILSAILRAKRENRAAHG